MLDSHPEVAFAEEFHYAVDAISPDGQFPTSTEFGARLALDRSFTTSGFHFDPKLSFEEMVNGFLLSRQHQTHALVVGATVHHGFSRALHLWPEAKLIHLIRDPRDVAAARIALGLAGNPWHAVERWVEAEDEWAAVSAAVPAERRLTIDFADLVRDHDSTLTAICGFIGVDYTGQMLNYVNDTDYQEPNANLAGDWRDTLSVRDVQLVESRVGNRLERAGFPSSGHDPLEINERHLSWLRWHDRAGRVAGRVQRFGVRLTVADLAARAVGSAPLQRSVQAKFNQAEMDLRKKSWSDAKYRTSR